MSVIAPVMPRLRRAGRATLDLLLPPRCLSCGEAVADPGRLCGTCFAAIDFIAAPACACCGLPFTFETGPDTLCAACAAVRPPYTRARAAARYGEPLRTALLRFKHGDRTDMAVGLALLLRRAGQPWLGQADMIAAVPLHRTRLLRRRYNQSAELARALSALCGVPAVPDLLLRQRRTRSQGGLSGTARRRNVQGAFSVSPRHAAGLKGRHVILVDDVMTTGATVEACARTLVRAGAADVTVLTVARVVRSG
ncbi:MAG: ComF family protein [Pseudomonadota bacterium]|nr:ComF family protein [Pseudomonadota bacterium]